MKMMSRPYNKSPLFSDPLLMDQLTELLETKNHVGFFKLVYKTILADPDYLFVDDGIDIEFKRMQILTMQEYFIELEMYEECVNIKKWLDSIDEFKTTSGIISDAVIVE